MIEKRTKSVTASCPSTDSQPGGDVPENDGEQEFASDTITKPRSAIPSSVRCFYCGDKFGSRKLARDHFQSQHHITDAENMVKFKCTHCSAVFQEKSRLRCHYISVHSPMARRRDLRAAECQVGSELKEHIKSQHQVKQSENF